MRKRGRCRRLTVAIATVNYECVCVVFRQLQLILYRIVFPHPHSGISLLRTVTTSPHSHSGPVIWHSPFIFPFPALPSGCKVLYLTIDPSPMFSPPSVPCIEASLFSSPAARLSYLCSHARHQEAADLAAVWPDNGASRPLIATDARFQRLAPSPLSHGSMAQ